MKIGHMVTHGDMIGFVTSLDPFNTVYTLRYSGLMKMSRVEL